jgi:RNA polymerase sigma-70 factor (ECF subfamily)
VRFDTTRWSVVNAAAGSSTDERRAALTDLCERYWFPLYAYVRRKGSDADEANDLTQAFFATLLEKNYVADADPQRGRFRTFLLASLNHFLANERRREQTQKRGGGQRFASLNCGDAEVRYQRALVDQLTPERAFEREWVLELLRRVLEQLRIEAEQAGRGERFRLLEPSLTSPASRSYAETAKQLDMSEGAVKTAVHRLRKRFRELIRAEIAQTLLTPSEAEQEIRSLFDALA